MGARPCAHTLSDLGDLCGEMVFYHPLAEVNGYRRGCFVLDRDFMALLNRKQDKKG